VTPEEYEAFVRSKAGTPVEASILGLAGEVGELLDYIKKVTYHGHMLNDEKCVREFGDILFYLTDVANRRFGFSLQTIMQLNKQKLDARYPNGFNSEDSKARRDLNVHQVPDEVLDLTTK
jgi:NTP pyrophosphatase (non-canonical NTP hydrolase)